MVWQNESQRHLLSSKGIPNRYILNSQGKPKIKVGLPKYFIDQIKYLIKTADNNEWIAEIVSLNGLITIDDVQISDKMDYSELRWNKGDEKRAIGYIHYHPKGLIKEFSAEDFVLTCTIHDLRDNKTEYPYTIMGVIHHHDDKKNKYSVQLYAVKPNPNRSKQFEKESGTESSFSSIIDDMKKNNEILKMKEVIL